MNDVDEYDNLMYEEPEQFTGRKKKIKHYIGVETPFPVSARNEKELHDLCKHLDVFHWRKLEVNHWALIESQIQGLITPGELAVLNFLCNKVENWNVCFCNVKEFPCHEKSVYKFLDKLSPWSLRVQENNRGDLKILISPFLVWKGDAYRRDKHIKEWYERAGKLESY